MMDTLAAWAAKYWLPALLLCLAIGFVKVLRKIVSREPIDYKRASLEILSTGLGGALGMFIANGFGLNEGLTWAVFSVGCWMGIKLYILGEEELRSRIDDKAD